MQLVVIVSGILMGAFAAFAWHAVTSRIDTKPLFTALGRSVKTMLSDEGDFLQEYGKLLLCVGSFVLWNLLALAGALIPMLVAWPVFAGNHVLLIVVYSGVSMAGIFWLRNRDKHASDDADCSGLSVSDSQYFFLQVVENAPWLMRKGAALETRLLRRQLEAIQIDRPVFITGLARSGTTMLLELLAQAEGVATHRYRDFPFLMTPWFWNRFVSLFGGNSDAVQRPHQDGINITPDSPEAFEEPIWQSYFPAAHRLAHSHVLTHNDQNNAFNACFIDHMKKLLLVRDGVRYVSKGNYNVTRIEYLAELFPDARFVVPVRHPATHVSSLVRQQELFCGYASRDQRVPHYLEAAGHFEFGPQRVPISVDGSADRTLAAWQRQQEHLGYAIQWAAVYGYILNLLNQQPALAQRVMLVRYEDICANPGTELAAVLEHVSLQEEGAAILDNLGHIKKSGGYRNDPTSESVWHATEDVASQLGYDFRALSIA